MADKFFLTRINNFPPLNICRKTSSCLKRHRTTVYHASFLVRLAFPWHVDDATSPSSRLAKAFCGRTTRFDYGKPRKLPILRLRKQCSLCPLGGRFPRLLPRLLTRCLRVSSFPFASRHRRKKASRGVFFLCVTHGIFDLHKNAVTAK